ncbi:hypothetical protein CQA66_02965 [Helicobacter aurati]|uniref:Uncharacterized protein n=1 Tax=Helicobacter aurati TaxID=137778 RepID=A0A3D8J7K2_9HELI|nr:hypothetical protein [Helicobacter aurati]RDU72864.1 hypothetical protein CQA66_02965 [Helicobacter aurati]
MKAFDSSDLLLISVQSPVIFAVYSNIPDRESPPLHNKQLIVSLQIEGHVSDILPFLFANIFTFDKQTLESTNVKYHNYPCNISFAHTHVAPYTKSTAAIFQIIHVLQNINNITGIYYARGAGSLSAIKLTHIFLQTLHLTKHIPLYATNIFHFNTHNEIKAFGNQSFFYKDGQIQLGQTQNPQTNLILPTILDKKDFYEPCTPLYVSSPF